MCCAPDPALALVAAQAPQDGNVPGFSMTASKSAQETAKRASHHCASSLRLESSGHAELLPLASSGCKPCRSKYPNRRPGSHPAPALQAPSRDPRSGRSRYQACRDHTASAAKSRFWSSLQQRDQCLCQIAHVHMAGHTRRSEDIIGIHSSSLPNASRACNLLESCRKFQKLRSVSNASMLRRSCST